MTIIRKLLSGFALICLSGLWLDLNAHQATDDAGAVQTDQVKDSADPLGQDTNPNTEKPLNVPVYPKGSERKQTLSNITDLQDQYILLNDGSVISMADWILGALNKTDLNREMTDLERRLFLGEVARNMLREGRVLGVRPAIPLKPNSQDTENYQGPESGKASAGFGLFADDAPFLLKPPPVPLVDNGILNGPPIGLFNDVSGTSDPAEINGGKIRLLPDEFETFFDFHRSEWQERGTYLNMLEKFKKDLKKDKE
ncbi:hypothetical protein [Kordiimonas sp. SCSIO 12610]|uniref:hypothetical protein n=1 Tax=Kordiimonas sp. SCSIO 12610 TaxID=2829597 RepID=UPI0021099BF8|nr:hypothetical protein [Kordiimonas sp. SCSIO 12610]UTW54403.1 hypothetical protein KFF44_11345 [Kordiimonas sp. SCSIO 12610]